MPELPRGWFLSVDFIPLNGLCFHALRLLVGNWTLVKTAPFPVFADPPCAGVVLHRVAGPAVNLGPSMVCYMSPSESLVLGF